MTFILWEHHKLKIFGVDINIYLDIKKYKFCFEVWLRGKKQREKDRLFDQGY